MERDKKTQAVFKRLITDFHEHPVPSRMARDIEIPLDSGKIVSIVGVRRSGKTSLVYNLIDRLRQSIPQSNIVYINFEDDRLYPLHLQDCNDLIEAYYDLYPQQRERPTYFFFDEIQNVPHWEKFIRRIYDTLPINIVITGSSSKLLSSDIATSLRGRTLTYEIFPFSFSEYLRFQGIDINLYSSKSLSHIKHALAQYLVHGGFPETINASPDIRTRTIQDYADLIVYKDIIERYHIQNHALMKHVIKYSFANISTPLSINKLYNDFKSQGFKLSKDTLFDYFSYLNDAHALFSIPVFKNSVREQQRNPKKIYAVDTAFKTVFDASLEPDYGHLYENMAFLHLRRKSKQIYYLQHNQEVDFYCPTPSGPIIANISYDLSQPQTYTRECSGMAEALRYLDLPAGYLVTSEQEETVHRDEKSIHLIPLWKWLLTT